MHKTAQTERDGGQGPSTAAPCLASMRLESGVCHKGEWVGCGWDAHSGSRDYGHLDPLVVRFPTLCGEASVGAKRRTWIMTHGNPCGRCALFYIVL